MPHLLAILDGWVLSDADISMQKLVVSFLIGCTCHAVEHGQLFTADIVRKMLALSFEASHTCFVSLRVWLDWAEDGLLTVCHVLGMLHCYRVSHVGWIRCQYLVQPEALIVSYQCLFWVYWREQIGLVLLLGLAHIQVHAVETWDLLKFSCKCVPLRWNIRRDALMHERYCSESIHTF